MMIGAKDAVPDNEGGPKVLIQVFFLRPMVYTVIRRSGKNIFDGRMKLANILGMYPELEKYRNLASYKEDYRMEASKSNWEKKEYFKILKPT